MDMPQVFAELKIEATRGFIPYRVGLDDMGREKMS